MLYLCTPYTHADPTFMEYRFQQAAAFTYHHIEQGRVIFSPIVYAHQLVELFGAPTDALAWASFNEEMLVRASAVWVLKLDGWRESRGIAAELLFADRTGLPVAYKRPLE